MDFANAMKQEKKFTRTENGAVALNTTTFIKSYPIRKYISRISE